MQDATEAPAGSLFLFYFLLNTLSPIVNLVQITCRIHYIKVHYCGVLPDFFILALWDFSPSLWVKIPTFSLLCMCLAEYVNHLTSNGGLLNLLLKGNLRYIPHGSSKRQSSKRESPVGLAVPFTSPFSTTRSASRLYQRPSPSCGTHTHTYHQHPSWCTACLPLQASVIMLFVNR